MSFVGADGRQLVAVGVAAVLDHGHRYQASFDIHVHPDSQ
jgi:hypothetical protein